MYSEQIPEGQEEVSELLVVADKYLISRLKRRCEEVSGSFSSDLEAVCAMINMISTHLYQRRQNICSSSHTLTANNGLTVAFLVQVLVEWMQVHNIAELAELATTHDCQLLKNELVNFIKDNREELSYDEELKDVLISDPNMLWRLSVLERKRKSL